MKGDEAQIPENSAEGWQFKPDDPAAAAAMNGPQQAQMQTPAGDESVNWSASEFLAHDKGAGWYLTLVGIAALLAAVVYLLTKDVISTSVVIAAAALFGIYAGRRPKTLAYQLDGSGLSISDKFYSYGQFRSFAVMHDGGTESITFMPLRRFMPSLTIYFSPDNEQKIVELLSARLPMENGWRDPIDQFLHRIRF